MLYGKLLTRYPSMISSPGVGRFGQALGDSPKPRVPVPPRAWSPRVGRVAYLKVTVTPDWTDPLSHCRELAQNAHRLNAELVAFEAHLLQCLELVKNCSPANYAEGGGRMPAFGDLSSTVSHGREL